MRAKNGAAASLRRPHWMLESRSGLLELPVHAELHGVELGVVADVGA
jgi:hypothetical protein